MDIFDIVSNVSLFDGLPPDQIQSVADIVVEKQAARSQIIFNEGDDGDGFYVVLSGTVKVFKVSPEGKEQILHIFSVGEPFGEVPVFSGKPFPASAQALAKSRLAFFPKTEFVRLIAGNPSLALNMLAVLSMRLRQFTVQVENLSLKEVPGRLASYLLLLAAEQASTRVTLPISKGQLASLLGTIPETLSRIFAKMNTRGFITVDRQDITIHDLAGLEALSEVGKI